MLRSEDANNERGGAATLRLDGAHAAPSVHGDVASIDRRRVPQVLVGAAGSSGAAERTRTNSLRLWEDGTERAIRAREQDDPVWKRFRQNFDTLTHIARDPLVWH